MRRERGFAAVIAIILILELILAGCGSNSTKGSEGIQLPKKMKMSFAPGGEPKTLDPQMSDNIPEAIIETALFEGIMRLDKENTPQLAVAKSVEVSSDGLNYTITLKNTKFSNGDPLTASDFKDSWMHALNPSSAAASAYQLFYIKNAKAYYSQTAEAGEVGIKVVDDKTLEITLESPCPFFKSLLALPTYFPVDQLNSQVHYDWSNGAATFVGNGPFMLKSWSHKDKMVLVKNPNYYDEASVKLAELDFNLSADGKEAASDFEAGKLDGLNNLVPEDTLRFKKNGTLKCAPMLGTYFYCFNTTKKPLNDLRIRQALSIALNRQDLMDNVLEGDELPAYAFVPGAIPDAVPGTTFRTAGSNLIKEDIERAKQLLKDAGYPEGVNFPTLTILYNTNGSHRLPAEAIQDYWKKNLGVNVLLQGQDWDVYQKSQQVLQYDIAQACWIGDCVDPMPFLDIFVTNGGNNKTGWSNPVFDQAVETAQKSPDQTVRMKAMHDAEKILMQEMPIIPIYYYEQNYLLKNNIKGVIVSPLACFDFKNAIVQ
ncbi:ABC-type oligopeptide transport system, periplasmic component [Desulfosporosinus acidiphilus SJ4]|uniref:ABC-type oligopeptide transport system, periplasmic component n=1 Tax=Desulfosporosinus acidiphilus (strain DSM 22704 / JCM 16185 / SJ4) TaxID=646529 RepID=I4D8A0_DESAJ|nr:peptide ABC transporter substrate-binding protein [Desulfosporosinus acidiphilus]AFM42024.1 ABC-type oligopeptide transport system, periplasmic component [Desulfosporosinus acidiphilus SJ4]